MSQPTDKTQETPSVSIQERVAEIGQSIVGKLGEVFDTLSHKIDSTAETIAVNLPDQIEHLPQNVESLAKTAKDDVKLKVPTTYLFLQIVHTAQIVTHQTVHAATDIKEDIVNKVSGIEQKVAETIHKTNETVLPKTTVQTTETTTTTIPVAPVTTPTIMEAVGDTATRVQLQAQHLVEQLKSKTVHTGEVLQEKTQEGLHTANVKIQESKDKVSSLADAAKQKLMETVTDHPWFDKDVPVHTEPTVRLDIQVA